MTELTSYLTREQLRYIRRTGQCKLSQPQDIFPMIDIVKKRYDREKNSSFGYNSWKPYEHDISHILYHWPFLEVHLYVAMIDPKFIKNTYVGLENSGPESHYEQTAHNKRVYKYYLSIRDFIPLVRDAMVICG